MLFHFFFSLCLGIVLNMMADAQRIATDGDAHGSTAMLAEDILEVVIPFLTVEPPAMTICDAKEAGTPTFTTGGHIHVCCETCATLETPCTAPRDECSDCRILRTMMQLSWRWTFFMWDYRTDLRIL